MKYLFQLLSVSVSAILLAGAAWAGPEAMTDQAKRSYAIGANIGNSLKKQGVHVETPLVEQGLADALNGKSRLTDEEIAGIIKQLRDEARQHQEAERQKAAQENLKRGEAFRADYAKRKGVRTLPGGLLYRVLKEGAGEKPVDAEFVHCHYRGTLVDGKEFAASPPGKPETFTLAKIIPGWSTALVEMTVGDKWELVIPPEMAYGEIGKSPAIGPNETLIFEVELVSYE